MGDGFPKAAFPTDCLGQVLLGFAQLALQRHAVAVVGVERPMADESHPGNWGWEGEHREAQPHGKNRFFSGPLKMQTAPS